MPRFTSLALTLAALTLLITLPSAHAAETQTATGTVYHDQNQNNTRDPGEIGIPGVRVSNGRDIVTTDANGRYTLPVDDDTIVFVLKPQDWMTPLNDYNLPQFYYIHKPGGSPDLRYPGIAPTGPLPPAIDFPLVKRPEPNRFDVILFGDPQPRNQEEVDYIAHDIVEELIGTDAKFGVSLGDAMFDNLSLFENLNAAIAHIGVPWYNVPGNHDLNFDSPDDTGSLETFKRIYGPAYYAFDYGPVHFIVIDNVHWVGKTADRNGHYYAALGEDQVTFIRNDLAALPKSKFIVLLFHIPVQQVRDIDQVAALVQEFPHNLSIAAHFHTHINHFLKDDETWTADQPHHHLVAGTTSGSWWSGVPDEYGIPHTMMRDGTPNGYIILSFDGTDYAWRFKAARKPADFQMHLWTPEAVKQSELTDTEVLANIFNGTERSRVRMRIKGVTDWQPMTQADRQDPYYVALKRQEQQYENLPGRNLPGRDPESPPNSTHIWAANLPADLPVGVHQVEVHTVDMFNQEATGRRLFRVVPDPAVTQAE